MSLKNEEYVYLVLNIRNYTFNMLVNSSIKTLYLKAIIKMGCNGMVVRLINLLVNK